MDVKHSGLFAAYCSAAINRQVFGLISHLKEHKVTSTVAVHALVGERSHRTNQHFVVLAPPSFFASSLTILFIKYDDCQFPLLPFVSEAS